MKTCKQQVKHLFTQVFSENSEAKPLDKTDVYLALNKSFTKAYISTILSELRAEGFLVMSGINADGCNTYKLRFTND